MHGHSNSLCGPWHRNSNELYQRILPIWSCPEIGSLNYSCSDHHSCQQEYKFQASYGSYRMIDNSTPCHWAKKGCRRQCCSFPFYLKFSPSVNITDFLWIVTNNQAINIFLWQAIGRSGMFNFEACQKDIMSHVHGHCNIIFGGAWFFWLLWVVWFFHSSFK